MLASVLFFQRESLQSLWLEFIQMRVYKISPNTASTPCIANAIILPILGLYQLLKWILQEYSTLIAISIRFHRREHDLTRIQLKVLSRPLYSWKVYEGPFVVSASILSWKMSLGFVSLTPTFFGFKWRALVQHGKQQSFFFFPLPNLSWLPLHALISYFDRSHWFHRALFCSLIST